MLGKLQIKEVAGKTLQALETMDLLNTTKNESTFFSRLSFLNFLFEDFFNLAKHFNFLSASKYGYETFIKRYGEEKVTQDMITFITETNKMDYEDFKLRSIYAFTSEFIKIEVERINLLSQQKAKLKRRDLLISKIDVFITYLFQNCTYSKYRDEMEFYLYSVKDQIKNFK